MAREVEYGFTDRSAGDLAVDLEPGVLAERRGGIAPQPWTWLRQVHGAEVVVVTRPGEHSGADADAAVTALPGATLAIHTADCLPVLLWDLEAGVIGAAHAGWRGLDGEVLQRTVAAMVGLGADVTRIQGEIGPHISAAAYEFGQADLTRLAFRYGPDVIGATSQGAPALDLGNAAQSALVEAGVTRGAVRDLQLCTATGLDADGEPVRFSWRARHDAGRQAAVIWLSDHASD